MTPSQQQTVACADAWARGCNLPAYSELVDTLRMLKLAESTNTDRLDRERKLARAHQQASRQLDLIDRN